MEMFDWKQVAVLYQVVWEYAMMEYGDMCALNHGVVQTQLLCADNLDFLVQVDSLLLRFKYILQLEMKLRKAYNLIITHADRLGTFVTHKSTQYVTIWTYCSWQVTNVCSLCVSCPIPNKYFLHKCLRTI